jgi:3-oxoacyl-[acyl-carrier protein] reductase
VVRLAGAVAIVTGGGRGIGRAIAMGLAREGAAVAVAARTQLEIRAVAAEIEGAGGRAFAIATDVARAADVDRMVASTLAAFGAVDILVNSAGVPGPLGLVPDLSEDEWDQTIAVNLKGIFLCCKAALPHMMRRRRGNVVNLSGGSVHRPTGKVRSVPYQTSKFGVQGLTHGLAIQMRPYGVNVNALQPGPRATRFHADTPPEWWAGAAPPGRPEDVVPAAVYLAMLRPGELTGQTIDVKEFLAGTRHA